MSFRKNTDNETVRRPVRCTAASRMSASNCPPRRSDGQVIIQDIMFTILFVYSVLKIGSVIFFSSYFFGNCPLRFLSLSFHCRCESSIFKQFQSRTKSTAVHSSSSPYRLFQTLRCSFPSQTQKWDLHLVATARLKMC